MSTLIDLLGKVDNLNEPVPLLNHRSAIFGVTISFLILSAICGCLRLYIRVAVTQCPGWDDMFLVLAMLSSTLGSIGVCLATNWGLGTHFITLGLDGMQGFIKNFYLSNAAYPMSTSFIKLALLFQYLRLFDNTRPILRYTTIAFIIITALWGISYSFIAWVPCIPVQAYWDWSIPTEARWGFGSHNPDTFAATYESHVSTNVALDLIVFAIPIPLFLQPGLSRKSRLGLCCLFVLGGLVNVLSIWRLVSLAQTRAGTSPTLDPSFYACAPIVLAALEVDLATICASLPVFWPVIQRRLDMIFVTREVKITTERRTSMLGENAELRVLAPRPPSKLFVKDPFVRWYADPFGPSKVSKTEIEAVGEPVVQEQQSVLFSRNGFTRLQRGSEDRLVKRQDSNVSNL